MFVLCFMLKLNEIYFDHEILVVAVSFRVVVIVGFGLCLSDLIASVRD
jgi:hypothetical protein